MIRILLILLILIPGCGMASKLRGPDMEAMAERMTFPDGSTYEKAEMAATGGENSEGLGATMTPEGITTDAKGSSPIMNFGPLVVFGWMSLLVGLLGFWAMKEFPFLGRLVPNSAPAVLVFQGVLFAFMTQYAFLLSTYVLMALVIAGDIAIVCPGWWNNLWRLRLSSDGG